MALSATTLSTLISAVGGTLGNVLNSHGSMTAQVNQFLSQIQLSVDNPAQVANFADAIQKIAGVPLMVALYAQKMGANSTNQAMVLAQVAAIQSYLSHLNSNLLSHLAGTASTS
jgi:hypothetical protein